MKPVLKYLLILLAITLVVGFIIRINEEHLSDPGEPERIPAYEEVVPEDFSIDELRRVLDPRDAGSLIQPRLSVVRIADDIIAIACPRGNLECRIRALTAWVRQNIEHTEVVQERAQITSPEETILLREGDDMTSSILLASLLRAEGYTTRVGMTPYSTFTEATYGEEVARIDLGCATCTIGSIRYRGEEDAIRWIS